MGNNKYYPSKCIICGEERFVRSDVINKNLKCKGCNDGNKTHGLSNHPAYNIWCHIRERCEGRGGKLSIKYYKNRGIKVCKEWKDVRDFIRWAKENGFKKGLEIDRIDNNKGYSPENCRFVNRIHQMRNTSRNNKIRRSDGKMFNTLIEASESLNKPYQTLQYAIKKNLLINNFRFSILKNV